MTGSPSPDYHGATTGATDSPRAAINDNVLHTPYSTGYSKPILENAQTAGRDEMAASDDLIDAKLGKAAAEVDTKIARLEGKLDLVLNTIQSTRDEARDNRRAVIANNWVIFGAMIVVVGILVTVAPVIFDMGFKWRETISKEIGDRMPQSVGPKKQ